MSKLSTGVVGSAASKTRTQPPAPVMGGVSKNRRSGASVHTAVPSFAGNTEVTCSSGTTGGASKASIASGASAPAASSGAAASTGGAFLAPPQPSAASTIELRIHEPHLMPHELRGLCPAAHGQRGYTPASGTRRRRPATPACRSGHRPGRPEAAGPRGAGAHRAEQPQGLCGRHIDDVDGAEVGGVRVQHEQPRTDDRPVAVKPATPGALNAVGRVEDLDAVGRSPFAERLPAKRMPATTDQSGDIAALRRSFLADKSRPASGRRAARHRCRCP